MHAHIEEFRYVYLNDNDILDQLYFEELHEQYSRTMQGEEKRNM